MKNKYFCSFRRQRCFPVNWQEAWVAAEPAPGWTCPWCCGVAVIPEQLFLHLASACGTSLEGGRKEARRCNGWPHAFLSLGFSLKQLLGAPACSLLGPRGATTPLCLAKEKTFPREARKGNASPGTPTVFHCPLWCTAR